MAATRSLNVLIATDTKGLAKGRKEAEKEFDKIEKAGDKLGASLRTSVGKAGASVGGSLRTGFKGLGAVGAVAGLAAGAALSKGIVDALDVKDANNKLQVQLGLTEKQSARMGKIAGAVYASNYGDSLGEVNTALKNVVTDIDGLGNASSKRLGGITGDVISVSKAFDQDLGGVTRAVGQLMRTGLAKDAQSALDIVTAGFQGGADKSQDFLDTLNEYGTQFRKLGLSGETATGLISQGLKAGARDGDLVADSLKEFSIRALDGSETTKKGFADLGLNADKMAEKIGKGGKGAAKGLDETLDRLRKIKDPVERSQTAVALFGTQAEDLGDALFALDPSNAVKGLGDVAGAARKANEQLGDGPKAKFEAFKRGLQQKFQTGITAAMERVPAVVDSVKQKVSSAWNSIKSTFSGGDKSASDSVGKIAGNVRSFVSAVGAFLSDLVTRVKTAFSGIGGDLAIIGRAFLKIQGVVTDVVAWIAKRILPRLAEAIGGLATVIRGVVKVIAGILSGDFSKVWDGVKTIVSGALKALVAVIRGLWDTLGAAMVSLGKLMIRKIGEGLKGLASALWQKLKDAVGFMADPERVAGVAKSVGSAVGGGILKGLGNLGHLILDKVKDALEFVADNVPGLGAAVSVGKAIVKKVSDATGDGIGKTVGALGSNLPSGTFGGGLMGARASMAPFASAASRFGLHVSSGLRKGAITSSGNQSYHSSGEAIDVAGSPDGMLGFFRQMKSKYGARLAELIYTPGGKGVKDGRPYTYGGQVARDHFDHVHVAYDTGVPGVGDGLGRNGTGDGLGKFDTTAYGPPWNAMNGSGVTATGVDLRPAKKAYGVAVDPSVIPLGSKLKITPNPFNYSGAFTAFDTGGAIKGHRIDFYDWRGRKSQMGWGHKNVTVSTFGSSPGASSGGSSSKSKPKTYKKNQTASGGGIGKYDPSVVYATENTAAEALPPAVGRPTGVQGFLNPTPPRPLKGGGPSKGLPSGYEPPAPGPTAEDYALSNIARARLTPGTDDDVKFAGDLVALRKAAMDKALADSDPRNDADAIDAWLAATEALKTLTDSIDNTVKLGEEIKALRLSIDAQTEFAKGVQSTETFQLKKYLADVLSGQIGRGIVGRSFTPGSGVEYAY